MERVIRLCLLAAAALPVAVSPAISLLFFALAGGPLALAALGFGGGALLARWSRVGLQLVGLFVAAGLQSAAYYESAYNVPTGELIGESIWLAVFSIPFGFAFGAAGRWIGDKILYAQMDHIWPSRAMHST